MKARNEANEDRLVVELDGIKRLLILLLLRDGASQGDIAKALGISQPSISRMFPGGIGKPVK